MKAFGFYYSGRHKTGARLQRLASRAVVDKDIGQYIYFRNNEVEFLNRGAYTPKALWSVADTLMSLLRRAPSDPQWSAAASAELRNLLASVFLAWPSLAIYRYGSLWKMFGATAVSLLSHLVDGADLDKYGSFLSASPGDARLAEAEAHYQWLGQGGRLINWYRFGALQKLRQGYRGGTCSPLHEAHRLAELSLLEAERIDDPCRLAKCQLVWAEINQELRAQCTDISHWGDKNPADRADRELVHAAWQQLAGAEVWRPYLKLAYGVYQMADHTSGRRSARLRILALALLETS